MEGKPSGTGDSQEENNLEHPKGALYHFSLDSEGIKNEGFKSSEKIDEGVGGDGQSLFGTYFFEDPKDFSLFPHWVKGMKEKAKEKGTKHGLMIANLPPDAKILDAVIDNNRQYDLLKTEFITSITGGSTRYISAEDQQKLTESVGTLNSPEFNKNFTKFLLEKGYDAVRVISEYGGKHTELIVINEEKLKLQNKESTKLDD